MVCVSGSFSTHKRLSGPKVVLFYLVLHVEVMRLTEQQVTPEGEMTDPNRKYSAK